MIRIVIVIGCLGIGFGLWLAAQEPTIPPQQPMVMREIQMRTNVTLAIHTTIYEVRGLRIDGQWMPLPNGTSVQFRFQSNIWSNLP